MRNFSDKAFAGLILAILAGCSSSESREDAPNFSGLYKCGLTSTEAVGKITAGQKYYRYFNISNLGVSQISVAYAYGLEKGRDNRAEINWISDYQIKDHKPSMLNKVKAWDGENVCFAIIAGDSQADLSVIDGRRVCAFRFSPGSGAYQSVEYRLPEQGSCERISD